MTAAVQLRNISEPFGEAQLLCNVSLGIRPGECISLMGPSGCGKSALLRNLAGLAPQSGETVSIDQAAIDAARLVEIRWTQREPIAEVMSGDLGVEEGLAEMVGITNDLIAK